MSSDNMNDFKAAFQTGGTLSHLVKKIHDQDYLDRDTKRNVSDAVAKVATRPVFYGHKLNNLMSDHPKTTSAIAGLIGAAGAAGALYKYHKNKQLNQSQKLLGSQKVNSQHTRQI